jgi:bifunctional non-homologous end joining protein LigD
VKRADSLGEYRRKRRAASTPEPFDAAASATKRHLPIFVVQRHDARSLHFDFRLERDGVLASWAVPKGVPTELGEQRLAVHVEDHPLSYATFEGEIPAGNYGAGSVEIWDTGTYELVEEKPDGGLTVRLHGERLDGLWALVPAKLSGQEKNWLILRKREPIATSPSNRPRTPRRKPLPLPMLASSAPGIPTGDGWQFELKWDGYRAIGAVAAGRVQLASRKGNDLTDRFPQVAADLAAAAGTRSLVVDGEVCALDSAGRPSFSAMQLGRSETPIIYALFDLLELDGHSTTELPLRDRRELLERVVHGSHSSLRFSESFDDGPALLRAVHEQGLEGVMAKRSGSPYTPGKRSRDWLKVKTHQRQEFVICGWTRGQGRRAAQFGSLVLGIRKGEELVYVGNCGTGFSDAVIDDLAKRLAPLRRPSTPFAVEPAMPKIRKGDVVWVEPCLVCEVEFAEWTHDGHLRAPSFQGLRDDKPAAAVHREHPVATERRRGKRMLRLTNLDKVFWPAAGITKGDLLAYYEAVAPVLVPHLRKRPFTMRRYPDGAEGKVFFQKDAPSHMPDWIPTFTTEVTTRGKPRETRTIRMPVVNDELALLWMTNMGCIDMNAWYSRVDRPDRPDFVLFDLDPSADVGFRETVQVALLVKLALDQLGLRGYPKTSGSDGIHVLVPIEPRYTYAQTRDFSAVVADAIAQSHPSLATTKWVKAQRRGVLIDANQNGQGKTIASAYSVRPGPGAPVSTPLLWDEVNEKLDPLAFTMGVVLERVRRHGDLFRPVLDEPQRLSVR